MKLYKKAAFESTWREETYSSLPDPALGQFSLPSTWRVIKGTAQVSLWPTRRVTT